MDNISEESIACANCHSKEGLGKGIVEKWKGSDNDGNQVASGVYFYQLEAAAQNGEITSLTKKMTLIG
jgi:hypothetical protein